MNVRPKALDWAVVCSRLEELAAAQDLLDGRTLWRAGQEESLRWIARQLRIHPGVLVADEVGLGKTRLAVALAVCVAASGGRVAVLIPPGLAYQWKDEELPSLMRQLRLLQPAWLHEQQPPRTLFLRTYADLFAGEGDYPLAQAGTILFISHNFGPPAGHVRRDELWALPYLAKAAAGFSAWGSGRLATTKRQQKAACHAAANCGAQVFAELSGLAGGRPSPKVVKDPAAKLLFEHLIGTLVGDVDLLVIDEAHKARSGADLTAGERRTQSRLVSRLTRLIDHIMLRPGSDASALKRLALTATPMELDAVQWRSIFSRLGIASAEVKRLGEVVAAFEKAVQGLRSGCAEELAQLTTAAAAYQAALSPIVTRRLWRDHPVVRRYAEAVGATRTAHPHREYIAHSLTLDRVGDAERQRLGLSEALAAAARGTEAAHDAKTAGMRFSQALPPMPEAPQDSTGQAKPTKARRNTRRTADDVPNKPVDAQARRAREARAQRQAHWSRSIAAVETAQLGPVANNPQWALQWHPRVRHAIDLIESLAEQGDKVLVFAEFLASLHALDRALNIRHYLRHMQQDRPIPLPQGVRAGDPDMQRWLRDPAFGLEGTTPEAFEARAAEFSRSYEKDRVHLRESCQRVLAEDGIDTVLSAKQSRVLTTWLVQQLCTAELLWQQDDGPAIRNEVRQRLASLLDSDPPASAAQLHDELGEEDDAEAAQQPLAETRPQEEEMTQADALAWPAIVEQLKDELQHSEATDDYVFRMSAFSQLMIGGTKTATRRARQGAFNHAQLHPRVLLGQSDVMSEGLNLHHACRHVVLFHLDWNPGRIEQQIGRVDRQNSAWMRLCDQALTKGETPPRLQVYTLSVQGTYDDLRTQVVEARARQLRAQLFGEIVPSEILAQLPPDAQAAVAAIDIDFRPPSARATP